MVRRRVEGQEAMKFGLMTCREATRLVSERLDRDLSTWERWCLWLHLLYCRACARYGRQINFIRRALASFTLAHDEGVGPASDLHLSEDAKTKIRKSINEAE